MKQTHYTFQMNSKTILHKLLFYWASSYLIASSMYYVLWLVMPDHYVLGAWFRMPVYHWEYPLQYIAIPCFFYGILASVFSDSFLKKKTIGRILLTFVIIVLTILISSPFGGMLWHFHDMLAGYFPPNWTSKMIKMGSIRGLEAGWLIILTAIPYNIFGSIVCYFLTRKGSELFRQKTNETT